MGTRYRSGRCAFRVWAPLRRAVDLELRPSGKRLPMRRDDAGYWSADVRDIAPGDRYVYVLDGAEARPDPASSFQPEGVHAASAVVDHEAFAWTDASWKGLPLAGYILYELHVGAFSPEGTFDGVIARLDYLKELGVNAVELMPVGAFPGERNWGYDGAYPFAVQASYGGPQGLKRLVDAAHARGLAVVLDVVYNHLGPEGNYLAAFGPYFTDRYTTPWGAAINFDGAQREGVRHYVIANALMWFRQYHIDALRLDAIHGVFDASPTHILQELAEAVDAYSEEAGRPRYLIAESDLNEARVIRRRADGGFGVHASWCDDFHHAVHALLTGEKTGYYRDFGHLEQLAKSLREGYAYTGEFSAYRQKEFGTPSGDLPGASFVVFSQNHDQVGNRMLGDRLIAVAGFEKAKLAAAVVLLSPYIPLLFMGEEYGEQAPFLYFVSHTDEGLVRAVREGRRREFAVFAWQGEPPDAQSAQTFERSRLRWGLCSRDPHRTLLEYYRALIRLRRGTPAFACGDKKDLAVTLDAERRLLGLVRGAPGERAWTVFNFSAVEEPVTAPPTRAVWAPAMDSSYQSWKGPGIKHPAAFDAGALAAVAPYSCLVCLERESQ
ncbi:MAG: malto-oligosyltrehalose trehalohydrolase [Deltaproteobacteria bacterium]